MNAKRMILCVEDDIDSCEVVTKLIESSGMPCVVRSAHNTDDAIRLIAKERFDLYVLDTWMPEIRPAFEQNDPRDRPGYADSLFHRDRFQRQPEKGTRRGCDRVSRKALRHRSWCPR